MLLVDTSVWIHHFRFGEPSLADRLSDGLVVMHPFVLGELACGNLKNREVVLSDLQPLPAAISASDAEVLQFIEERRLYGRGLGWVDLHLLAAAVLNQCKFWTLDRRLSTAAKELGLTA